MTKAEESAMRIQTSLSGGLKDVLSGELVGKGYVEASAGVSSADAFARLEAGYRPLNNLGLFGYGQLDQVDGADAGVGIRWTF